jgi:CHAD domain-containing protein
VFSTHPLPTLLSQYLRELVVQLHEVRRGSEEAIHQARVGIRRAREVISLGRTAATRDELADVEKRLARAARALSRVRDADVAQHLIQHVAARFLVAARPLAHLRAQVSEEQVAMRRKAIKKLEALELESLTESLHGVRWQRVGWLRGGRVWSATLSRHMISRAAGVREATELAGGAYFPNRLHAARVATKQLRYSFELADRTGVWRPRGGLNVLKKVQATLGDAHDRQMLLERLAYLHEVHPEWTRDEVDALHHFIHAEILDLHDKYIERRSEVLAVCDSCLSALRRSRGSAAALLVAGVVVPSIVFLRRRSLPDTVAQKVRGHGTSKARAHGTSRHAKTA